MLNTLQAEIEELYAKIAAAGGATIGATAQTVTSGQTVTVRASDAVIRMDTTGGPTATAILGKGPYIGKRVTFYWWAWGAGMTPPTINATGAGVAMVPFSGQASSGAGGLVTSSTISTPGATYTLEWTGIEWTSV